jgi:N-methylhydantoinase A
MKRTTYRLGVDIGGTFTDMVLVGSDGSVDAVKILSSPPDFGRAVVDGLRRLLERAGLDAAALAAVLHGTTVATNAILEGRGARTALITSEGFRDVLELARMRHPSLYDVAWEKPRPLVPRRRRFEVPLRIDADGTVRRRLDAGALEQVATAIAESGAESVAVCLINSYVAPGVERELATQLTERVPDTLVSASVDILPEMKEFERTSTTVVNAYVRPLVHRYLDALEADLSAMSVAAPLTVMQSSGGLMDSSIARDLPVQLIESGPAAGVTATRELITRLQVDNAVAFDMGGTTAKASLIERRRAFEASEYEVGGGMNARHGLAKGGGYTIRVPSIDIAEVGAGGGSICWVDEGGAPRVGPHSAGADPGPACYGRGGTEPTLTDAKVVLGYLSPEALAGGTQPIRHDLAEAALGDRFARPLRLDLLEAAFGVYRIAVASMSKAVRAVTSQRGRDPRDFALVSFGGAGPAYAAEMAREFGISQVIVPPNPGLFSAVGLLVAEIHHHDVRSLCERHSPDPGRLSETFREMEERLRGRLEQHGHTPSGIRMDRFADMRYVGQSSELRVPVPASALDVAALERLGDSFGAEHERTYGHRGSGQRFEIVNLRVRATLPANREEGFDVFSKPTASDSGDRKARNACFGGEFGQVTTPVLGRTELVGRRERGPVIVEEMDGTTVVPPYASVRVDDVGNLVIEL